jgi:hypothetical protein
MKDILPSFASNKHIHGLLKFGKREHLRQLRDEGTIFMRPLQDFHKMEGDPCRHDQAEGIFSLYHNATVKIGHPGVGRQSDHRVGDSYTSPFCPA